MRFWIGKIWLILAVIIITAHSLVPHYHDNIAIDSISGSHDHDKEGDDHGIFSFNFLSHSYTRQEAKFDFQKQIVVDAPADLTATVFAATNSDNEFFRVCRSLYSLRHEFPPPQPYSSLTGFCGPPSLI